MASNAISSQGIKLKIGNGATPTELFNTIAEVVELGLPEETVDMIECTNLESEFREYVPGIPSLGEFSITISYLPTNTQHEALREALRNKTKKNYQVVYPDTDETTDKFSAYVVGFAPSGSMGELLTAEVTFQPTGTITRVVA